ncbi:hypothetical protein FQA39_LY07589 [Lamprigera yunnana]|nr:hypothetical protein FQA39_LY07589 [Lamprigera yunnana]
MASGLQFILTFLLIAVESTIPDNMNKKLISVEFEVFGRVQGVFFRKYTQQESKKLGLRGWCRNTERGTVLGVMEGEESKINNMKNWLQYNGSPSSKIDKAEFKNVKDLSEFTFSNFSIKR